MCVAMMRVQDLRLEVAKKRKALSKWIIKGKAQVVQRAAQAIRTEAFWVWNPVVRKLIKDYRHRFEQLSLEERFGLAKRFYRSGLLNR